jgi:NitT/TauT family transport system permease protein
VVATLALTVPQILRHTPSLQALYEELLQSQDVASEIGLIPAALGSSIARLFIAYLLSIAWTLPLAVRIAGSRRTFGAAVFAMQVLASIPATAVFPIIILATMELPGGLQLTSIILTMTGMQWYLLFNLLGGVRSIPSDLLEASQTYRLKGFEKWRKLVIPAILPSFISGSITAWGGGWNALVVSEYIVFGRETVAVLGIGALLDKAAYNLGSVGLLFVNIAVMVVTIVTINRLLWRRSYHLVLSKYRMDY